MFSPPSIIGPSETHITDGNALTIATHRRTVKTEYGVLHLNGRPETTHRVTGYDEKPEFHYVVSMGVYIVGPGGARARSPQRVPRFS